MPFMSDGEKDFMLPPGRCTGTFFAPCREQTKREGKSRELAVIQPARKRDMSCQFIPDRPESEAKNHIVRYRLIFYHAACLTLLPSQLLCRRREQSAHIMAPHSDMPRQALDATGQRWSPGNPFSQKKKEYQCVWHVGILYCILFWRPQGDKLSLCSSLFL